MNDLTNFPCNEQRDSSRPLKVYREGDRIIINKYSTQMGIVELDEEERIVIINKLIKLK